MEIDSERQEEMVTFPLQPSSCQRELVDPIDPDDPVDIPRDIAVGQKS
jgi:hypothetical protein